MLLLMVRLVGTVQTSMKVQLPFQVSMVNTSLKL